MLNDKITLSYKILAGLSEIAPFYDAYFLDVWGLLHDGIQPFPGVLECLQNLKSLNKKTLFLSNSPRRGFLIKEHLATIGIPSHFYDEIITSGDATYYDLKEQIHTIGNKCFFIGQDMHRGILKDVDLRPVASIQEADFILNMGPENLHLTLDSFLMLFKPAIENNILMICSNPDMKVMIGENQILCAGSLAKEYEMLGGRVHYHGKPYPFIYELAFQTLNIQDKSKVLALGDSLPTDIEGAQRNGIHGALVMSGLHGHERQMPFGALPTAEIISILTQTHALTADYYLSSLKW